MSADPPPPAGLSRTAAAEPAAAASTPAAGSKRRASDVDAQPEAVEHQPPSGSQMDDAAPVGSLLSPSSVALPAAQQSAAAASARSASDAVPRKKQRLAPSAVPAAIAPPWSTLYSDALHSIFKFASLEDLTRLLSVSRRWGEAVMTMPPIAAPATIVSGVQLIGVLTSRVRRHVTNLWQRELDGSFSDYEISSLFQLQFVSVQIPWLTELCVTLPRSESLNGEVVAWCAALSQFRKLRKLTLRNLTLLASEDDPPEPNPAAYNRILQTIGELNALTISSLWLELPSLHEEMIFTPLVALTQLRFFNFTIEDFATPFSDTQINQLRALTAVEQMWTPYDEQQETDFLVRLLQPGHALQWNTLGYDHDVHVTAQLAAVLGSLPTLSWLSVMLHCPDVQFLSHLTALTALDLDEAEMEAPVDPDVLVASLRHCTQIKQLALSEFALTGRHAEELLSAFPGLTGLTLFGVHKLDSLRCLSTAALAESLTELELRYLPHCPTTEIAHLFGLRSLQSLHIEDMAEPLTDDQKAELTPHSQRFPQLHYSECDRE